MEDIPYRNYPKGMIIDQCDHMIVMRDGFTVSSGSSLGVLF